MFVGPASPSFPPSKGTPGTSGYCPFNDGDSVTYASADYVKNRNQSDYTDSNAFDQQMRWENDDAMWSLDTFSTGSARSGIPPQSTIQMTKAFLRAGGAVPVITVVAGNAVRYLQPVQANVLYISTHGYSGDSTLATADGKFGPNDIKNGEWKKGLCMVIIADCSVLDVTGDKWNNFSYRNIFGKYPPDPLPGYDWLNAGPCLLLGYEGRAPQDKPLKGLPPGVPEKVVRRFFTYWQDQGALDQYGNTTFDPAIAWVRANQDFVSDIGSPSSRNACAIRCCSSPRTVVHLRGQSGGAWRLEELPETNWASRSSYFRPADRDDSQ